MGSVDDRRSATVGPRSARFDEFYAVRGAYQHRDTTQTLREGLAEYYEVNPGLSNPEQIEEPKAARYFHNHDCTHVVFGTHTGALDEGVNDLMTFFGVDVSVFAYISGFLATEQSKEILKAYEGPSAVDVSVRSLRLLPRVWRTCRAMKRKWPWDPPEHLYERPLVDIRAEYGIDLWRPEAELRLA